MKPMTPRERFVAAGRRQPTDRVPRLIEFEHEVAAIMSDMLGITSQALRRHFRVDLDYVVPNPSLEKRDYSKYFDRPDVTWNDWGAGRIWDQSHHYAEYLYPLSRAETVAEIEAYPWPDLAADYRAAGMPEKVAELHANGICVAGGLGDTIFETAWQIRSMDRLFEDMALNEAMATALLEKIMERRLPWARAYAAAGVDVIHLADDVATQNGLLMSRNMFAKWFKPFLQTLIRAAREIKPDILFSFHSDGRINDLVPDLIEIGVDILNPVQPECVDHRWIQTTYGERLSFSGGLGVQSILPFGTVKEVREHVRETIEVLGRNHGLIIGPAHILERDIPPDNIKAMLAAIDEFGGT